MIRNDKYSDYDDEYDNHDNEDDNDNEDTDAGADSGFFLGGGALVSCST